MKSKWLAVSAFLQANILAADAQIFGLTDPRLCYLLDGILFFYAIIVTALFFREKLIKKARKNGEVEDNYSHLHPDTRAMHSHTDNKRGNAKLDNSALYQALEKDKLNEPYSGINVKQQPHKKKGREHDKVYQGLNAAQRDTYDALQMQPIR